MSDAMDLPGWQDRRRELLAHPDDIGVALKSADWLDERGDPRGEFVRLCCDNSPGGRHYLLAGEHGKAWWGEVLLPVSFRPYPTTPGRMQPLMQYGFITEMLMSWQRWSAHGDRLARREPIRRVRLTTRPEVPVRTVPNGNGTWRYTAEVAGRLVTVDDAGPPWPALLAARWPGLTFELPPEPRPFTGPSSIDRPSPEELDRLWNNHPAPTGSYENVDYDHDPPAARPGG